MTEVKPMTDEMKTLNGEKAASKAERLVERSDDRAATRMEAENIRVVERSLTRHEAFAQTDIILSTFNATADRIIRRFEEHAERLSAHIDEDQKIFRGDGSDYNIGIIAKIDRLMSFQGYMKWIAAGIGGAMLINIGNLVWRLVVH